MKGVEIEEFQLLRNDFLSARILATIDFVELILTFLISLPIFFSTDDSG